MLHDLRDEYVEIWATGKRSLTDKPTKVVITVKTEDGHTYTATLESILIFNKGCN